MGKGLEYNLCPTKNYLKKLKISKLRKRHIEISKDYRDEIYREIYIVMIFCWPPRLRAKKTFFPVWLSVMLAVISLSRDFFFFSHYKAYWYIGFSISAVGPVLHQQRGGVFTEHRDEMKRWNWCEKNINKSGLKDFIVISESIIPAQGSKDIDKTHSDSVIRYNSLRFD